MACATCCAGRWCPPGRCSPGTPRSCSTSARAAICGRARCCSRTRSSTRCSPAPARLAIVAVAVQAPADAASGACLVPVGRRRGQRRRSIGARHVRAPPHRVKPNGPRATCGATASRRASGSGTSSDWWLPAARRCAVLLVGQRLGLLAAAGVARAGRLVVLRGRVGPRGPERATELSGECRRPTKRSLGHGTGAVARLPTGRAVGRVDRVRPSGVAAEGGARVHARADRVLQLRVGVRADRVRRQGDFEIRKLEGNPDHPGSRGRNCAKGPATINQITRSRAHPLPAAPEAGTPRGGGEWERVSWDHVLDTFAERMHEAFAAGRTNDVCYFVGRPGEDGFAERFLETWGCDGHNSHTNVCSSGGRCRLRILVGHRPPLAGLRQRDASCC